MEGTAVSSTFFLVPGASGGGQLFDCDSTQVVRDRSSPRRTGPGLQTAVLRSEKPPKTAGLRRTASHRDLGSQGKGADGLTKQHRDLHSRGQDAVRRHLESSQGSRRPGTRSKSRRRQRTATFPGAFEDSERVVTDIRTIMPRLLQDPSGDPQSYPQSHSALDPNPGLVKLPSISSRGGGDPPSDSWMLEARARQGDDLIRRMMARATMEPPSAVPEEGSAGGAGLPPLMRPSTRAGVPQLPSSFGRGFRGLLETGVGTKEDLTGDLPRGTLGQPLPKGFADTDIQTLLGSRAPEDGSLGVTWDKATLHLRRRKLGWCGKHPAGHEDCPRCLMRKLRPRTIHTKRVGGGYVALEESEDKAGFDGHGAWRLLADGSYLLPDGSKLLPDGTRILADGRRVLADGTVLDADGNVIGFMGADGKFTSGVKNADGSFVLNDGTRVLADGTRILADGTRVLADGTRVLADGTRVLADGTRILADGTRILADGTVVDADGNVIGFMGADGNIMPGNRVPDGFMPDDGSKVLADGTRVLADGTQILADGTRILADGTRILADGTRILPDGTMIDADGNVIGKMDDGMTMAEALPPDAAKKKKKRRKKVDGADGAGGGSRDDGGGAYLDDLLGWIVERHDGVMTMEASEQFFAEHPEHKEAHQQYDARPGQPSTPWVTAVPGDETSLELRDQTFRKIAREHADMFSYEENPDTTAKKAKLNSAEISFERTLLKAAKDAVGTDSADVKRLPSEPIAEYERRVLAMSDAIGKDERVIKVKGQLAKAQAARNAASKVGVFCASAAALAKLGKTRKKKQGFGKYNDGDDGDVKKGRDRKLRSMDKSKEKKKADETSMVFVKNMDGISALDYLSKYCILGDNQLLRYRTVFKNIDVDRDGVISQNELGFGLRTVNNNMITVGELDYVNAVLEVRLKKEIDFRMFAVISALSEKVTSLDRLVRGLVNQMDAYAMAKKMMGCKKMYYLLDEHSDGLVEMDMLVREVRAGRITQAHEDIIVAKFSEDGKSYVDFLDFLTYIPLFMEIHDTINDNPLEQTRDK